MTLLCDFNNLFHDHHLVEISALGGPDGGGPKAEDEGGGDEGVELREEQGGHVGRVAEDADHEGPLDQDAGAGEDQAHVHRGGGPGPQVLDCVDRALQLAHRL